MKPATRQRLKTVVVGAMVLVVFRAFGDWYAAYQANARGSDYVEPFMTLLTAVAIAVGILWFFRNKEERNDLSSPDSSLPSSSRKVQALRNRARELSKGERQPTIGELLALRRETQRLRENTSIPTADRFALSRLTDAIDDTLDKAMNAIPSTRFRRSSGP